MGRMGVQNAKEEAAREASTAALTAQQLVVTHTDNHNGQVRDMVHNGTFSAQAKAELLAKDQTTLYNALGQNGITKDVNKLMVAFNKMTIQTGTPTREILNQRYVKATDAYGKTSVEPATPDESAEYAFQDLEAIKSGTSIILGEAMLGNNPNISPDQATLMYERMDEARAQIYTVQQSNLNTENIVKKAEPAFKQFVGTLVDTIGLTTFNNFDPSTTSLEQLESEIYSAYNGTLNSEEFLKFKTGDDAVDATLTSNIKATFPAEAKRRAELIYGAKQGELYKSIRDQNALANLAALGLGGKKYSDLVASYANNVARENYANASGTPMGMMAKFDIADNQLMYAAIRGGKVETQAEFKYFLLSNMLTTDSILGQEALLDTLDNTTTAYKEAANRLMTSLSSSLSAMADGDAVVDPRVIYRVSGSMLGSEGLRDYITSTGVSKSSYMNDVQKLQNYAQRQIQTFDSTGKILNSLNKSINTSTVKPETVKEK